MIRVEGQHHNSPEEHAEEGGGQESDGWKKDNS
jgi:hypothetical protein